MSSPGERRPHGGGAAGLAADGRDPRRVPANWRRLLDPDEWRLNAEGLPFRRAARVIALRRDPRPAILLVVGHDFSDASRSWAFTPGGGLLPGETPLGGARRELAEETGIGLAEACFTGPVVERRAVFAFNRVTCRQDELFYLTHLAAGDDVVDQSGWTDTERELLDSLRWWELDELDAAVAAGMTVYPRMLPALARELMEGWDGRVRHVVEH
ncbi:DNA mismatch repair protein MutT [Actinomyces sp. 432]|uniref:NUDIX hydrolase n=1 Tax=unclassified Actinomyces TaxID=2609248 RepID=UPI0013745443|nr:MULTISPECIES: NUDIX domain-containing protein [unclassified Actinomyces]MBW3068424.1 NUDIX domain-containing protein [Actinomyces sp. 594]QHO90972.1 DNA mismatch repair protein MutT [Actinomyces sp. 432]